MNNEQIPAQQNEENQTLSPTIPSMDTIETMGKTLETANPYGVSLFPMANDSEVLPGQTRLHWFMHYGTSFGELSDSDKDDFERALFVYAGILPILDPNLPSSHIPATKLREIYQAALADHLKEEGYDESSGKGKPMYI